MAEYEDRDPNLATGEVEAAYRQRAQRPAQRKQFLDAVASGKGAAFNTAPGATRRPLIDAAFDDHNQGLEELLHLIQLLEQRLSPVLAPVGPETGARDQMQAPRAALPPLAERLSDMTRGLRAAGGKIQELISRLEV